MHWETVDGNIWENADLEGGRDRGSGPLSPHPLWKFKFLKFLFLNLPNTGMLLTSPGKLKYS